MLQSECGIYSLYHTTPQANWTWTLTFTTILFTLRNSPSFSYLLTCGFV